VGARTGRGAQLGELAPVRRPGPVREERDGVDAARVQHAQRLQVVVERVPAAGQIGAGAGGGGADPTTMVSASMSASSSARTSASVLRARAYSAAWMPEKRVL
jgi:hypothetical protein